MKLYTVVEHALENIFGYGDISDLTFGDLYVLINLKICIK